MLQTLADAALRHRLGASVRVLAVPRPRCTSLRVLLLTLVLAALDAGLPRKTSSREPTSTRFGLNFLLAGYGYSAGGVATDPSLPLQNADLQVQTTFLAYVRSLTIWGRSGKIDVVLPYAWLSGSADVEGQPREREVSGLADPRLRLSINLYGAPALSLQEFAHCRQDLIIGTSLQVSVPLGQYDPDKLVNIGTNRWAFKPEIGLSKAVGPLTLELTTGAKALLVEPYTTMPPLGSDNPSDLWQWMTAYEAQTGGDVLAIAHNGHLSNGRMFPFVEAFGKPLDRAYAETRATWDRLYEVTQTKGPGEAHPFLAPHDEFANFAIWDKSNLDGSVPKTKDMLAFEYARSGLKLGLKLEQTLGVNPYKFGMIGSSDAHTGLAAMEDENFFGKTTPQEPSP